MFESQERNGRRGTAIPAVVASASAIGAAAAAALWYDRYLRRSFNELGRAYDPATHEVYLEQAGCLYGGIACVLFAIAVVAAIRALRRRAAGRRKGIAT